MRKVEEDPFWYATKNGATEEDAEIWQKGIAELKRIRRGPTVLKVIEDRIALNRQGVLKLYAVLIRFLQDNPPTEQEIKDHLGNRTEVVMIDAE